MSGSNDPTSEEIIAALERTGFLLEQRAAEKLKGAGFDHILNSAFPDPDTGKSREIDVLGSIDFHAENESAFFSVHGFVLVECKNYSSPIILVGKSGNRSRGPVDHFSISFDPLAMGFPGIFEHSVKYKLLLPYTSPDPQWGKFIGSQMVRMDRKSGAWVADNSSVYDGILYPLVKARQHELENPRRFKAGRYWEYPMVMYYFPVLLTSGSVYTVAVDGDSDPRVSKAKWAQLVRTFHGKELRTTLRVDVVSFDNSKNT